MGGDAGALGAGRRALEAGDWAAARDAFEAALAQEESGEALLGLATALWWLGESEAALRCRERAYAALCAADPFQAAVVAFQLSGQYGGGFGNLPAARGWLGRAVHLVEQFELTPLEGWVAHGRAAIALMTDDPRTAEMLARQARDAARRTADADLELCALTVLGAALVAAGRVDEGTALLDEAMAGALAGEGGPETVVEASCITLAFCSRAAEVKRAAQWIRAAEDFNRRYGSPHVDAICRTYYGAVLLATGRWAEAETALLGALEASRTADPLSHAEALARLAELRLAQGRIEEAARLLDGCEGQPAAAYGLAAVHRAHGELATAASMLRRRLAQVGEECLECAALLELLTEIEVERGAAPDAAARARRLAAFGARVRCDLVAARGERALGRALAAVGDGDCAVSHVGRALGAFTRLEMPYEAARTRLLLAQAIAASEPEAAIAEARGALASFEALGAARDADAAASFLRGLGVKAARAGPRGLGALTRREREVLALLGEGLTNREIAERLFVTRKTAENHVASVLFKLDLSGRAQAAAYAVRHPQHARQGPG